MLHSMPQITSITITVFRSQRKIFTFCYHLNSLNIWPALSISEVIRLLLLLLLLLHALQWCYDCYYLDNPVFKLLRAKVRWHTTNSHSHLVQHHQLLHQRRHLNRKLRIHAPRLHGNYLIALWPRIELQQFSYVFLASHVSDALTVQVGTDAYVVYPRVVLTCTYSEWSSQPNDLRQANTRVLPTCRVVSLHYCIIWVAQDSVVAFIHYQHINVTDFHFICFQCIQK